MLCLPFAAIRRQIEAGLAHRIPSALTPTPRIVRETVATGICGLDELLPGGLPVGAISEIAGPECSGRTSLALSFVAQMTAAGKDCSWVDVSDSLHPESAAAIGVNLSRFLWVRCGVADSGNGQKGEQVFSVPEKYFVPLPVKKGLPEAVLGFLHVDVTGPRCAEPQPRKKREKQRVETVSVQPRTAGRVMAKGKPWTRIEQALRVTDLLLQAGGFSAIVMDMGGIAPEYASRVPLATWFRYRAAVERNQAVLLLLTQHTCTKSSAGLVLRLEAGNALEEGNTVLSGMEYHAEVVRERFAPAAATADAEASAKRTGREMAELHLLVGSAMSRPAELYACLFVRQFPAQALLRLRPELRDQPCAVMEGKPPLETVCSLNAKARSLGIEVGMTRVEIDTFSAARVLLRSVMEEDVARVALLECAGGFSPRVEEESGGRAFICVIDIAGTEKLFGAPRMLSNTLLERVRALGMDAQVAVSHNFEAAISLARGTRSRAPQIFCQGEEGSALAVLPLSVLKLSEEHTEVFSLWGIQTLGMLAELPEKELISRLGQEGKRLRWLARGEMPHLFVPHEPAFALEERMELDNPVEMQDSLLFVVGMMLEQLILRASARVLALASVTITLSLEGGTSHTRTVRPALPSVDRQLWIKLIHLDLEAHPPEAAILAVTLTAEPGRTSTVQVGLFSPPLLEPMRLDVTLARIRKIVGENCVGRAVLTDTHQGDAFRMEPFAIMSEISSQAVSQKPRAAMRRLRPAENATVTLCGRRPTSFYFRNACYTVERAYGPWMASGEWWNPGLWSCEQWDLVVRSEDGSLLCCVLTCDQVDNCWQLTALYD